METLILEQRDGIAHVTLNRPERLNAINRKMIAEMHEVLDEVERDDDLGVVVLAGVGRAFCSGFDLKDDATTSQSGVARWQKTLQDDFDFTIRFWEFKKPTIAAVHGYCLAGGFELAMACDITIAAEGTMLGEPELRFGSVITTLIMPWLAGPKRAKELLLTGNDRITAERAERIGLVNQVVPDGEHLDAALAMARRIAANDRDAVSMTKRAINRTFEVMGLHEALRAGLDTAVQLESLETPSRVKFREITRREGLKAAIAWRDSRFPSGKK